MDTHSVYSEEQGVVFGTLTMGTDLMEGIMYEYEKYNLQSGLVTCIGSLSQAGYIYIQEDKSGNWSYSDEKIVREPIEVLNGTGFLCRDESGTTDFHLHGLFSNQNGGVFGGHLLPGQNPTLITIEFTIQTGKDIKAIRTFKPELRFKTLSFQKGAL